jgi:hypothetical protein
LSVLLVEENSKSTKPLKRKYKKKSAKKAINQPSANENSNSNDSPVIYFKHVLFMKIMTLAPPLQVPEVAPIMLLI